MKFFGLGGGKSKDTRASEKAPNKKSDLSSSAIVTTQTVAATTTSNNTPTTTTSAVTAERKAMDAQAVRKSVSSFDLAVDPTRRSSQAKFDELDNKPATPAIVPNRAASKRRPAANASTAGGSEAGTVESEGSRRNSISYSSKAVNFISKTKKQTKKTKINKKIFSISSE